MLVARRIVLATLLALSLTAVAAGAGQLARIPIPNCPVDSVRVGQLCVDRYEATLWRIPLASKALQRRVFLGIATFEDLTRGGAQRVSIAGGNDSCGGAPFPPSFPADGAWKADPENNAAFPSVVAVSISGVPAACVTWYQAQQACAASGKRLLTVEEWRRAAIGTPTTKDDGGFTCTTAVPVLPDNRGKPNPTGSRYGCTSSWGAYDMLGNVEEWTADLQWVGSDQVANTLGDTWNGLGGATIDVHYSRSLNFSDTATGFRCAR